MSPSKVLAVGTRPAKLDPGGVDATLPALAGLERLGLEHRRLGLEPNATAILGVPAGVLAGFLAG